jgi:hypothetical protein
MNYFDVFTFISIIAVALPVTALVSIVFETQGANNDKAN